LVFGEESGPPAIPDVTLTASGRLTGLRGTARVKLAVILTSTGRLTGLRGSVRAAYDVNVDRSLVGEVRQRWQDAKPLQVTVGQHWEDAPFLRAPVADRYQEAAPLQRAVTSRWQDTRGLHATAGQSWQEAKGLQVYTRQTFQEGRSVQAANRQRFQEAERLMHTVVQRFQEGRFVQAAGRQRFQETVPLQQSFRDRAGSARQLNTYLRLRYEEGRPPPPGRSVIGGVQPPEVDPCYLPVVPANLVFKDPWTGSTDLVFFCERHVTPPGETIIVPVLESYIVINSSSLVRADNGANIPCTSMGLTLDRDSYTWNFRATAPIAALPLVRRNTFGEPIEAIATINGEEFNLLIQLVDSDREFAKGTLAITGTGKSALLADPYSPIKSFFNTGDRNAQQIGNEILTDNGVGIGWDLQWNPNDWLVPAGVWNHQGTYITALQSLAASAGGYLQPHNTDDELQVHLHYPEAPWNWGDVVPDFELPSAVASRESIRWAYRPRYNRVFVQGMSVGVRGRVTRAGTAGDLAAQMVVDALMTHEIAARQRGIPVLANTGSIATVGLKLPVLESTGVIKPGRFVRYVDEGVTRIGLSRSVAVAADANVITQTLEVEVHE